MSFVNTNGPKSGKFTMEMEIEIPWRERKDSLILTPPPTPPGTQYNSWPWKSNEIEQSHSDEVTQLSIRPEDPVVAVIGVGYIGVHLVENFATQYPMIAFDVSKSRLDSLSGIFSNFTSISSTTDAQMLKKATHFLISVPTSVLPDRSVDTSHLKAAIATVKEHARHGATVVIESSVAVGMTRELLGPLMREKGIKGGMSPERVDPGRTEPPAKLIPKIISGLDDITPGSLDSIKVLYSRVFASVITVSTPEVAEMTKLFENCQRMMCIAYANEMADACIPHNIDPSEVCSAASSKPFGYMPYAAGLGVGGPCIPVNPYYLLRNCDMPLLRAATESMWERPGMIANRAMAVFLKEKRQKTQSSHHHMDSDSRARVLVVGLGFKRGQSLLTHSPGVALIQSLLENHNADISFADPLVSLPTVQQALLTVGKSGGFSSVVLSSVRRLDEITEWKKITLEERFDIIIVAVEQEGLDFGVLDTLEGTFIERWN